jgi:hypothetical protein
MLLDVPAGSHHITLTRDDEAGVPDRVKNAKYVSLAALLLVAGLVARRRKKRRYS